MSGGFKRGVGFKCLTGVGGEGFDFTTSTGKLVFSIFSALCEFERNLIRERTIAVLEAARTRGNKGGRASSFTPSMIYRAQAVLKEKRILVADLCRELGVTRTSLYRNLTPDGELRPVGERVLPEARPRQRRRAA